MLAARTLRHLCYLRSREADACRSIRGIEVRNEAAKATVRLSASFLRLSRRSDKTTQAVSRAHWKPRGRPIPLLQCIWFSPELANQGGYPTVRFSLSLDASMNERCERCRRKILSLGRCYGSRRRSV